MRPHADISAILPVIDWLDSYDCRALDDIGLIAELGRRLRQAGLPIDRLALHRRTLHPDILGRSIVWSPNEPVEVHDRAHGMLETASFKGSPLQRVMETGEPILAVAGDHYTAWLESDFFHGRNIFQHYIVALSSVEGPASAVSFCTAHQHGFSISDRAVLDHLRSALSHIFELRSGVL